jgi:hypothetical protein
MQPKIRYPLHSSVARVMEDGGSEIDRLSARASLLAVCSLSIALWTLVAATIVRF